MKPRIFVSSTFYDLKYIREDISNFIKSHDFEPIMFEDGDIGYSPYTPLDKSCYEAMESADMAVLIIGGNYGSPASGEKEDPFEEFISVTRSEFKKAVEKGIPVFVFVDANVYAEYGIYELNSKEIESGLLNIKFRATKSINVFRFIREIKNLKEIAITEFDKVFVIKDFLSKQWADMFKNYLSTLKDRKQMEQLQDSIDNMNVLIAKMEKMINAVGKKVFEGAKEEYQEVVEEQETSEIQSICFQLSKVIKIGINKAVTRRRKDHVTGFLMGLTDFYNKQQELCEKLELPADEIPSDIAQQCLDLLNESLASQGMQVIDVKYQIYGLIDVVSPILNTPDKYKKIYSTLCDNMFYYRFFRDITNKDAHVEKDA